MKLVFLGTRGYIEPASRRHRMHTATLVVQRGRRVLIDCGETWRGRLARLRPHAIVVTHAHPDHAFGLADGAPCPVWATAASWRVLRRFPIAPVQRRRFVLRRPQRIAGIGFEAFPVVHSVHAPAVGFRIRAGRSTIFYVPDVLRIRSRSRALRGVTLYVGDGATLVRPLVRRARATGTPIGHASIRQQLEWCRCEGVARMIVTHCGSAIVGGDGRRVAARLRGLARESGVRVELAHDGMERRLP